MNKIMDYKEFKIKRIKLLIALLIGVIFIYLSNLLVINPGKYVNFLTKDALKIKIIGIIGLIFFGLATIVMLFLILSSLRKSIGIVIDQKGIYSNYTMPSVGLIKWQEISDIQISNEEITLPFAKNKKNNQVIVILKKPNEFLKNRNLNSVKKMLFKQQINKYGSPVILNHTLLNCTFQELQEAVFDSWEKYKKNSV